MTIITIVYRFGFVASFVPVGKNLPSYIRTGSYSPKPLLKIPSGLLEGSIIIRICPSVGMSRTRLYMVNSKTKLQASNGTLILSWVIFSTDGCAQRPTIINHFISENGIFVIRYDG